MYCHCAQCRKTAGGAFIAVFPVRQADFDIIDRGANVSAYCASPGKARYFCRRCGSPLYSQRDGADTVRVRAGLFDELPHVTHGGHIFSASAAPWDSITDDLPRHSRFEPERAER